MRERAVGKYFPAEIPPSGLCCWNIRKVRFAYGQGRMGHSRPPVHLVHSTRGEWASGGGGRLPAVKAVGLTCVHAAGTGKAGEKLRGWSSGRQRAGTAQRGPHEHEQARIFPSLPLNTPLGPRKSWALGLSHGSCLLTMAIKPHSFQSQGLVNTCATIQLFYILNY